MEVVDRIIGVSAISSVNLTEVVTRMLDWGVVIADIHALVRGLPCDVAPFDRELALSAGLLRSATRSKGLSLGDRACLALAHRLGVPALTADRQWAGLDIGVEIQLIRQ